MLMCTKMHGSKDQSMQRYLTFQDLQAKLGGRGRTTIYRDVEIGRLPKPFKIGHRLYWREAEIETAITSSKER